jgi:hypothetical protein
LKRFMSLSNFEIRLHFHRHCERSLLAMTTRVG